MKLTIEKNGSIVKAIKAEYTPAEWLVIDYAMRSFAEGDANETDRAIMMQMLNVEPEEKGED